MHGPVPVLYARGRGQGPYVYYTGDDRGSYERLDEAFVDAGLTPSVFDYSAIQDSPADCVRGMEEEAHRLAGMHGSVVLAGFSQGAYLASLAARTRGVDIRLLVCSLSPLFCGWFSRGYQHPMSGHRRFPIADQRRLSAFDFPEITGPALILVGRDELPVMGEMSVHAHARWPQSRLCIVPCGHNVLHESYLRAIRMEAGALAAENMGDRQPQRIRRSNLPGSLAAPTAGVPRHVPGSGHGLAGT